MTSAGCGGGETEGSIDAGLAPGGGGLLTWMLPERPQSLDPLYAETAGEQLITRQVHEPLIAELNAPVEGGTGTAGLALAARPSADATVWRVRLRGGVRFQDGTPFDASAVLANIERWQSSPAAALPAGTLADAPRPGLVRFILASSDPGLDRTLASPRLGIVSPRAFAPEAGAELDASEAATSGTGPFELRERGADRLLLARNTDWWGTDRGLGPAIDQLEFTVVADPAERVAQLAEGTAQVAGRLGPAELARVREDPLLTTVPQRGGLGLGIERSVRGIPPREAAPPLNGVWRTALSAG